MGIAKTGSTTGMKVFAAKDGPLMQMKASKAKTTKCKKTGSKTQAMTKTVVKVVKTGTGSKTTVNKGGRPRRWPAPFVERREAPPPL